MKMKVGGPIDDDVRRAYIIREEIGPDALLMMDANQVWDVEEAIANMRRLAVVQPYWIEEPTHADDVLGHARIACAVAPIRVATGEVAANRVIFKQLLQADAFRVCQVDAGRVAGVNEVVSILLMAAKFGVPVCPHAGGVGLCEYGQHLAIFDYLRVGTSLDGRMIEYVDHLHEHFVDPVRVLGRSSCRPRPATGRADEGDKLVVKWRHSLAIGRSLPASDLTPAFRISANIASVFVHTRSPAAAFEALSRLRWPSQTLRRATSVGTCQVSFCAKDTEQNRRLTGVVGLHQSRRELRPIHFFIG